MLISCSICRDKINSTHDVVITANCGHLYHKPCYEPWIKTNPTCPTCRTKQKNKAIKVYFTTQEDAVECPDAVIEQLEQRCEAMGNKYGAMEKELNIFRGQNEAANIRISTLENEMYLQTERASYLSTASKRLKAEVKRLAEDNVKLERSVKENATLQRFKIVLEGTHDEVTEMLKNTSCDYNSVQALSTFVAQLKRCNLKEKGRVQELVTVKKELMDELKALNRHVADLESRLQASDENCVPVVVDLEVSDAKSVEYVDLEESFSNNLEKAFGIDRQLNVLDQRKFDKTTDTKIFPKSWKNLSAEKRNQMRPGLEYDGMGGSMRFWQTDPNSKPYQRPSNASKRPAPKLKTQHSQQQFKDFFVPKS